MTRSMCSCDVNRNCHSVFTISNRVEPRPACVAALHPWLHGSDTRALPTPSRPPHHRLPDCAGACICVRGDAEDEGEGTGWPGGERQRVQLQGTRESCAALRFWAKEGDRATVAAEATRGAH